VKPGEWLHLKNLSGARSNIWRCYIAWNMYWQANEINNGTAWELRGWNNNDGGVTDPQIFDTLEDVRDWAKTHTPEFK